jgi:hypothetical protein
MINIIVGTLLTVFLGLLVFIFRDTLKNKWVTFLEFVTKSRYRTKIRILHLPALGSIPDFDFSQQILALNHEQNMFLFQIEDTRIPLSRIDLDELIGADTQPLFLNKLRQLVSHARGQTWDGTDKSAAKVSLREPRDLLITDIPIPGNFYGWNSRDRTFLVISPVSVRHLFPGDPEPSIVDFIIRMVQRMAVFSVSPRINPLRTHYELAAGCLFDFTPQLKRIRQVVTDPILCDDCMREIKRCRNRAFALDVVKWIEIKAKPSIPSE